MRNTSISKSTSRTAKTRCSGGTRISLSSLGLYAGNPASRGYPWKKIWQTRWSSWLPVHWLPACWPVLSGASFAIKGRANSLERLLGSKQTSSFLVLYCPELRQTSTSDAAQQTRWSSTLPCPSTTSRPTHCPQPQSIHHKKKLHATSP